MASVFTGRIHDTGSVYRPILASVRMPGNNIQEINTKLKSRISNSVFVYRYQHEHFCELCRSGCQRFNYRNNFSFSLSSDN